MNFQITRIRLAGVGPEPARYDPLELDLRKPDHSGPADTVLFLPNTGGKTVLMRLVFSVLHPPIVERIGTEEATQRQKNLLGYVLERDTAHIVIEWRRVDEGRFVDDQALVTGLVAEWRGGRPTGKPEDLIRVWYSMRGSAHLVGIDQLVFEVDITSDNGPGRRRLPLRRFREQLEEFKKTGGRNSLDISITEVQRDWVEHLDRLGLDRALFRYQGEMNHNEAGASAIARFKEDRDFIKFFLDAVFDPAELAGLDREFNEVADKVRRFPEYERRLRFEQAALEELEPLVGLVSAVANARTEAQMARTSALNLLAAFVGAETAASTREQRERQRERDQDAEARRLIAMADRFRDEWREFRKLAAVFWRDETEKAHAAESKRKQEADMNVRAWAITEDLARHADADAKVRVLDEEYAAETERLRPLQTARDQAAMHLARQLAANAVIAANESSIAKSRATEERKKAAAARREEQDAHVEAAKLDADRQASERRLEDIQAFRDRLISKGLLLALDERSDEACNRESGRAAQALARLELIDNDTSALNAERRQFEEEDRAATSRVAKISESHARLASEIERAQSERNQLSSHPLVIELAETPDSDLELVGSGLAERLLGRAKESEDARLALELKGADDRRALRSLDETGYLPPPPEVEAALGRLAAAGIAGAVAGTRYVAEAVARDHRNAVAANRADLVGGIILTDPLDFERACATLNTSGLDPSMIIAVGTATELITAERNGHQKAFIVPPSESVWDRAAAGVERAHREERLASLDEQREVLEDRAASARSLAEALVRHATAYPVGWLSLQMAERDALSTELTRLNQARADRDRRRAEIAISLDALGAEAIDLRTIALDAEQRVAELQRLVDEETAAVSLTATIERQVTEAKNWRSLAENSARAACSADEAAERAADAAHDHRAAAERIRQELSSIRLAELVREPSLQEAQRIADTSNDLFELRARFAELDRQLAGETSSSDVAARRNTAIEVRNQLAVTIATHPEDVRERAARLLASPYAGDLAGRRAAAERAIAEANDAHAAERVAFVEYEKAKAEVESVEEEIRSSRRSAKIPDERAPRDRHHAAVLAAEARQNADNAQSQVAVAERERNSARDEADRAKQTAERLRLLVTQLRLALKLTDEAELPTVQPFEGNSDQASEIGATTLRRVTEALDAERDADKAWRDRDSALRAILAREEFADLAASDRLYRRLVQSAAEVLARDAGELVAELRTSIGVLQAELASLEEDRKLATTSLAKSVNKALSYLKLAEARSKMPAHLRDWSGESFLEIRFDKPPAEELDVRLRTFVIQILDPRSDRPVGSKLLMLALERAVGHFRVRILKPNEAFAPIRVPIAELSSPTFSNGQRATVATAMMLMLSELRRQSRSAARDASVGTLLLDNPLGNANAGFLIDVQRTVAAAAGIQLVYTTGIADLNALRRFPNVIALSNDAARRTMRRYVRANPALLNLLVPPEDGSGGRLSARRVVSLTGHEPGRN